MLRARETFVPKTREICEAKRAKAPARAPS